MLTTLLLTAAVALIAVQPLLVRTWPWLDARNRPRPTLLDLLHEAALTLPVPAAESTCTPEHPLGPEYGTVREQLSGPWERQRRGMQGTVVPAGWVYDGAADRYRDVATGMTARRDELQAELGNAADVRLRQQLAAAVADGHTQTEANLRALDLDRQMGAAQRELDRRLAMADAGMNAARGICSLFP